MINKILIATHNPAKITELKAGLNDLRKSKVELLTLTHLNITAEPEESGKTFRENAILKAKYYSNIAGLPAIADDGGLAIPFLNNEPGVKSNRWLGRRATDRELIEYTLIRLKDAGQDERKAYLETCICFYSPLHSPTYPLGWLESEKIAGKIAEKPYNKYMTGFPYRALLIVDKFNKYYDALSAYEHRQVNHRLKALKRLVKRIKGILIE